MKVCTTQVRPRWDIFCRIVDNFGDIGVCWRLARELARRQAGGTRLWVDDWPTLCRFLGARDLPRSGSVVNGVALHHWSEALPALVPGEVVIEAFACELPPALQVAMAQLQPPPLWINLEYLSAESWVEDWHRMRSPHPRLPLLKHFFFPGFDRASGGLLRESNLIERRDGFRADAEAGRQWRLAHGLSAERGSELLVSLFSYRQPWLASLVDCWAQDAAAVCLLVPEGKVLADLQTAFGRSGLRAGDRMQRGALEVIVLPFSDQDAYDRLLWSCDLNFVRGEDSFVRAQWAGRPLVWQIYAQNDDAHFPKLDAFIGRYQQGLDAVSAQGQRDFWRAWNGDGELAATWPAFRSALPRLRMHAENWCERQAAEDDLCARLMEFGSHSAAGSG